MQSVSNPSSSLQAVVEAIQAAERCYGRKKQTVRLVAVSKKHPAEQIRLLRQAGQKAFAENYLQEAMLKIDALAGEGIEWHFIGAIQSKKAQTIAQNFDWVHSLDRIKVARKLDQYRDTANPLNVLIQVNLQGEASKGGVSPDDLFALADEIALLKQLRLRGLMFMPEPQADVLQQRAVFAQARKVFENLQSKHPNIDQLSMGMSGDFEPAIAEGSTMVRIGTALFGSR